MGIRKLAQSDDFESIGGIYVRSWQAAYKGIIPQDYLDSLSAMHWLPFLKDDQYESYVIMDDEKYAGTSCICSARDEEMKGWGEIASIYLLPEYWGTGYAEHLMKAVMGALIKQGFKGVYLWVLDGNIQARKFYEKYGFIKTFDMMKTTVSGKELTEIKYVYHC